MQYGPGAVGLLRVEPRAALQIGPRAALPASASSPRLGTRPAQGGVMQANLPKQFTCFIDDFNKPA